MVRTGDVAPDFELQSDTGEMVRLSSYRGQRVVLYFFVEAGTSG